MKSAVFQVLAVILALSCQQSFQVQAGLDDDWMSFFPVIAARFANANTLYRTFVISAREEYLDMTRAHQSRALSRIGHTVQGKMDFEREVMRAIQERAVQIGNNSTQCLLDAERGLAAASETAGMDVVFASRDWLDELHHLEDEYVTPILEELDVIISLFEIEVFVMLGYANNVTEIEFIISTLYIEALLLEALFETFVDELIFEFGFFEMVTNSKNQRIFQMLDNGMNDYIFNANVIRNSLANCNA